MLTSLVDKHDARESNDGDARNGEIIERGIKQTLAGKIKTRGIRLGMETEVNSRESRRDGWERMWKMGRRGAKRDLFLRPTRPTRILVSALYGLSQ